MAENLSYAIQYDVAGKPYAAQVADGQLTINEGTVAEPLATISMDEAAWNEFQSGAVLGTGAMLDPEKMDAARLEKIRNTKGKLHLELTKEDGTAVNSTTVFGGSEAPEVTLMMKAEDFAKIMRGELNSQMAFMTGKLKFKGDMNFLMKLGGLM